MGTAGPPGNFDIHNLFKSSPQPGYNPPAPVPAPAPAPAPSPSPSPSPYPNLSHPFHNFSANNLPPPNSYGPSTSPLSGSYPFMAQGSTNQQYPPYLQDQAPRSPLYQNHSFPQPPPSPPPSISLSTPPHPTSLSRPSSPSLDSARLMALLTYQSTGGLVVPTSLELPPSGAHASNPNSDASLPPTAIAPAVPSAPPVSLAPSSASGRLTSNKLPRGRHLRGEHIVYDVDVRLPGEAQPQLEVSPITMYASDPVLLVGRQIAVNRSYICYGLRPNRHIRILNINTASRSLLRGHTERVTDMAFFAEDVHLLASASSDGRVFVRRIVEGPGEDNKLQITDQILLAVQFTGDWESVHPRVCWLCHTQDVLVVAMGKYVFTVDMSKVRLTAATNGFSTEEPVLCPVDNPIEGVRCVVGHDGEVTDLSISQWTILASASKDGTIRVWKDQNMLSLSILTPHEGQPVGAVAFLSAPLSSDHIVLLSAGPLNQELKLWVPATGEGWFPQSGPVKWKCIQTLELKSSAGGRPEDAFFNQVLVVPRARVILLANAKRSALYVIHVDFGSNPSATRMTYLAEFSVVWPILSFTATSENVFDGDGIVQVYCVQTQAIQQYSLDLSQCLPPVGEPSLFATEDLVYGSQVSSGSITNSAASTEASTPGFEVSSILRAKSPGPISGVSLTKKPLAVSSAMFGSPDNLPGSGNQSAPISMESTSMADSKVIVVSSEPQTKEVPTRELAPHISNISAPTPQIGGTPRSPRGSPLARERVKSPIEDGPSTLVASPREHVDYFCLYEQSEQSGDRRIGSSIPSSPNKAVRDPFSLSPRRRFNDNMKMNEDNEWELTPTTLMSSVVPELQSSAGSSVHLITPSELMSMVARSKAEVDGGSTVSSPRDGGLSKELIKPDANSNNHMAKVDSEALRVETKKMTESTTFHADDTGLKKAALSKSICLISDSKKMDQTSTAYEYSRIDTVREANVVEQAHFDQAFNQPISEGTKVGNDNEAVEDKEPLLRLPGDEACEQVQEVAAKVDNSPAFSVVSQARKKKNKNKTDTNVLLGMMPSSSAPLSSVLASIASTSEQDSSNSTSSVSSSGLAAQITAMQDSLNQLVAMHREFQKQIAVILAVPVAKEVKRMEAILGQRMEKVLKAHMDAMWARLQEDNAKREKAERDRVQQLSSFLSNSLNKDLPAAVERALKKEFSSIGPSVAHLVTPSIEKTISIAVNESFQKGISEKGVAQLEKSVGAKIEASLSRQLQAQFQTSGKHALQEALRSCLEGSVIPAFERACQAMFGQVDAAFQKGISEHQTHAQQELTTSQAALASTLQDAVASATSLAASLKGELADGQRRLLSIVESAGGSRGAYIINGSLPEKAMTVQHVEESLDPTKELARLILERKLEEAFNKALSLADVGVVSWLCNQVDLATLLTMTPPPLSQGVLLALVQQLGCDLGTDTGKKLMWIKDAALALNPHDPGLPPHVMRHFLEKLYNNLHALLATSLSADLIHMTRLVIHVVNSLLTACK